MRHTFLWIFLLGASLGCCSASAQDTAAQEAAHRATVLAQSPPDAAKVLFGREVTPTAGPAQAIGETGLSAESEHLSPERAPSVGTAMKGVPFRADG